MNIERLVREVLSRKDPRGYYVIVADRRALNEIRELISSVVDLEEAGDVVFIRVASRSIAEKMIRTIAPKGLLKTPR